MQANSNRQQEAIKCLLVINGGECKQGQGIVALQPWFNIHWYGEEKKKGLHAIQLYHTSFFFFFRYSTVYIQPNEKSETILVPMV